jgi:hypothetical protein
VVATDSSSPHQTAQATFSINVVRQSLNIEWVQQPTNTTSGQAINPAVRVGVRDNNGAVIPGTTVTISLGNNPGGDSFAPQSATTNETGVAGFSGIILNAPGVGYTLVASVSAVGYPSASSTSNAFDILVATLTITSQSPLPNGNETVGYNTQLTSTGGTGQIHWSLVDSTLPRGLDLTDAGRIVGTPSEVNFKTVLVRATDSGSPQQVARKTFSIQTWAKPSDYCLVGQFPLYNNWNTGGVSGGGTTPTIVAQGRANGYTLVSMATYHLNPSAPNPTLGLSGFDPWQVTVEPATPGYANWKANVPGGVVLNGSYTVNDSDPNTWAQNDANRLGFTVLCVTPN